MSIYVNHDITNYKITNTLNYHITNLVKSTDHLASGLRIKSSSDDAAGLAIRELQRSDISALNQGIRNLNDAISLIQTADSALAIIDENLIRMKELSMQASTGTYNSMQRQIIGDEFQEMSKEINRISESTNYNGIHLLNGNLDGQHDGTSHSSLGQMKIHFGSGNDEAEDYYYIDIPSVKIFDLFYPDIKINWPEAKLVGDKYVLEIDGKVAGTWNNIRGFDFYRIPSGLTNLRIESQRHSSTGDHKPHVSLFSYDGAQLTGTSPDASPQYKQNHWNGMSGTQIAEKINPNATYQDKTNHNAGATISHGDLTVHMITSLNEVWNHKEVITIDEVQDDLVFLIGGHANGNCNNYDLYIEFDIPIPNINTQEMAQQMLNKINVAMEYKDKVRAHLGALQNRFENTLTVISNQVEYLSMSESRISDIDVSIEMTKLVESKILSESAEAMLAQATSTAKIVAQILPN